MVNNLSGKGHQLFSLLETVSLVVCMPSMYPLRQEHKKRKNVTLHSLLDIAQRDNGSLATFCNIGPLSPPFSAPHQNLLSSQCQATRRATSTSSHQSTIHLHFSSSHGTGPLSDRILQILNVKRRNFENCC